MKNAALIACIAAVCAFAQQPRISNARLENREATGGLDTVMRAILAAQSAPAWVGYAVPIVKGDRQMCCWNNGNVCGCSLESRNQNTGSVVNSGTPVRLEGPTHLVVLYRVEDHKVDKVRTFTPDCELDAGGLQFIWLNGVQPADSIRYLVPLVAQEGLRHGPLSAIAMHADPAADQALEQLTAASAPEPVRRDAAFWLGNARGRRGFEILSRMLREDPSDKVRERTIFALTQSKEPEAMNTVMRAAHDDKSPHVRGQALFWMAQKAGDKVVSAIQNALENDPDTEVKKKAVFALTQMPNGEGVPLLIQVARTNRNPAVRKQAVFWLGQSKDPRALQFLEDVLTGNR
jgi:HEAT repeat protein